jgi:hypothetical protein
MYLNISQQVGQDVEAACTWRQDLEQNGWKRLEKGWFPSLTKILRVSFSRVFLSLKTLHAHGLAYTHTLIQFAYGCMPCRQL